MSSVRDNVVSLPERVHYVDVWELRAIFNAQGFHERAQHGDLTIVTLDRYTRTPTESVIPHIEGTRFEIVEYRDSNNDIVARAKQWRRADGALAYSGLHDPLYLLDSGIVFKHSERRSADPNKQWCIEV